MCLISLIKYFLYSYSTFMWKLFIKEAKYLGMSVCCEMPQRIFPNICIFIRILLTTMIFFVNWSFSSSRVPSLLFWDICSWSLQRNNHCNLNGKGYRLKRLEPIAQKVHNFTKCLNHFSTDNRDPFVHILFVMDRVKVSLENSPLKRKGNRLKNMIRLLKG